MTHDVQIVQKRPTTKEELIELYTLILFVNVHHHQPFAGTRNDADMIQARQIIHERIGDMEPRARAAAPDATEQEVLDALAGALDVLTLRLDEDERHE